MKIFGRQVPSLLIFDPTTPEEMQEEPSWRPDDPNILQVEMIDLDEWAFYRAPDTVREFVNYEALFTAIKMIIRNHLLRTTDKFVVSDINYEAEILTERFLSMVSNFRLANLDLATKTIDNLLDNEEACKYRGMGGALR